VSRELPLDLPLERLDRYMGARDSYSEARAVLFGIPMDFTTSYRPGTRFGPGRIREASYGLEEFSYHQEASLQEVAFCDLGDVAVVFGDPKTTLDRALQVARRVVADGKLPFVLGGEHLVTLPVVQALLERYPDLVLLQFDAHADLREEYLGNPLSHACVMRRCLEAGVRPGHLFQFGIRSGTREEYDFGRRHCRLYPHEVLGPLRKVLAELEGRPVYITVDIDVMDPAYAPGTGTPEPGGVSSREMLTAIHAMRGLNVVGFDVVEVAPNLDPSDRTVVLGALLIREALLAFAR